MVSVDEEFEKLRQVSMDTVDEIIDDMNENTVKWVGIGSALVSVGAFIYVGMKNSKFAKAFSADSYEGVFKKLGLRQNSGKLSDNDIKAVFDKPEGYFFRYEKLSKMRKDMFKNHPFIQGLVHMNKTKGLVESKFSDNQKQGTEKVFKLLEKSNLRDFSYELIEKLPTWNKMVFRANKKEITNFGNALVSDGCHSEQGGIFIGEVRNGILYVDKSIAILNDKDIKDGMLTSKYKFDDEDFYNNVFLSILNGKKLVGTWHIHPPVIGTMGVENDANIASGCDDLPSKADKEAWAASVDQYNQISAIVNISSDKNLQKICFYKNGKCFHSQPMQFNVGE